MTRNGSKDAESRKDVPFWGQKNEELKCDPNLTQNPIKKIGPE